jgi:hypothetical protein
MGKKINKYMMLSKPIKNGIRLTVVNNMNKALETCRTYDFPYNIHA